MADAVTTNVLYEDKKQYVVHLTSLSDGTGETNVVKVDKSAIGTAVGGAEATALDIERVDYTVTGFTSVKITWDHATDSPGLLLTGANTLDFTGSSHRTGAKIMRDVMRTSGLQDPKTADSTGDVLLTSSATSGGAYAITLWLSKRV